MPAPTPATLAWRDERNRLLGIAYRMLGDFGHAEDVVSEVAIDAVRFERETPGQSARSWPAWLTTVCVRRSIDRVRQLVAIREEYTGPWLPEPLGAGVLPEEAVANREMLSLALLHLAEQLPPEARAALVLHRAFELSAVEIGEILEKTPAAVRQMVSRAERRLNIDPSAPVPRPADRAALDRLVAAIENGDIDTVVALLDRDAILWSDGGGKTRSALNPIFGAERVLRFLQGILAGAAAAGEAIRILPAEVNGEPGMAFLRPGRCDIVSLDFGPEGRIRGIRQVSNPDKLTRMSVGS